MRVALALGGNIGDTVGTLNAAVHELVVGGVTVGAVSSLYETPPWGYADQPSFLNGAVIGETTLAPLDLLDLAKRIERDLGRRPTFRNAPRPVDIDLALYGNETVALPDLQIPHSRLPERGFVLVPLAEVAPDWIHPALGRTIAQLRATLGATDDITRKVSPDAWWPVVRRSDTP